MATPIDSILDTRLDGRWKGYPQQAPPLLLREVGARRWSLLDGEVGFPAAVLRASALDRNQAWMGEFLRRTGASLCPHGKTTMAPQLFHRQLADGAWGITVATAQQARVAVEFGVKRVLLANQLVHAGDIGWVQAALDADAGLDLLCLVDSPEGVGVLERCARGRRPLPVLVELGYAGGRTGARGLERALAVARAAKASARAQLRGVECFEGLVQSPDAAADAGRVRAFLAELVELARRADAEGLIEADEAIVTAGGSAYFDLVARAAGELRLSRSVRLVLRSGCAFTHDAGHYERLVARLQARLDAGLPEAGLPDAWKGPRTLEPAMEIWSQVLSRPEPGLALLSMGKRDVAHDIDLPVPRRWHRAGAAHATGPQRAPEGWRISALNDQHAYLRLPEDAPIAVGDLVGCGISHPCTTFDKWQLLYVVDDEYRVVEAVRTFF